MYKCIKSVNQMQKNLIWSLMPHGVSCPVLRKRNDQDENRLCGTIAKTSELSASPAPE